MERDISPLGGIGAELLGTPTCPHELKHSIEDAYGNLLTPQAPSPHGYSTKEFSSKSGLVYYGARYYEPRVGRFITKDPLTWGPDDPRIFITDLNMTSNLKLLVTRSGDANMLARIVQNPHLIKEMRDYLVLENGSYNPQYFNLYAYCWNNPINLYDPLGLTKKEETEYIILTFTYLLRGVYIVVQKGSLSDPYWPVGIGVPLPEGGLGIIPVIGEFNQPRSPTL